MHPLFFYALGRTPRESYSPIRTNAPSKSHFPQVPLCIHNALFLTLPKRDLKSHFPQVHSTLFFYASAASKAALHECTRIPYALFFYAPAASSKATFRKCTWHPACLILGSSSLIEKPLSASALGILHASFSAPAASSKSRFP
jgi:hypothetical protein